MNERLPGVGMIFSGSVGRAVGGLLFMGLGACGKSAMPASESQPTTESSLSSQTKQSEKDLPSNHPSNSGDAKSSKNDLDEDSTTEDITEDSSSSESSESESSTNDSEASSDEGESDSTGEEPPPGQQLVENLDFDRFKNNIKILSEFGSRHFSQSGNLKAGDWIQEQLQSFGYSVSRHAYTHAGQTRHNIYATKVGRSNPDAMYIVSAHMDSINFDSQGSVFAPGANDDASGTSLVLEVARVFAPREVQPEVSIRFILWNNEETGLNGSKAYVADRRKLQGKEEPTGSGLYPEPKWLGIIQHDMIMFDHGLPPQPKQDPNADVDIEYQKSSKQAKESQVLAEKWLAGNARYAAQYPAEVGAAMSNTDSASFQDICPSISVRENQRLAEIGKGSNPQWHRDTDVYETYSEADFRLGFNAAQTTVGSLSEVSGVLLR